MNGESSVDDTRMRDKQKTRRQDKLSRLQMLCYKTLRLAFALRRQLSILLLSDRRNRQATNHRDQPGGQNTR